MQGKSVQQRVDILDLPSAQLPKDLDLVQSGLDIHILRMGIVVLDIDFKNLKGHKTTVAEVSAGSREIVS